MSDATVRPVRQVTRVAIALMRRVHEMETRQLLAAACADGERGPDDSLSADGLAWVSPPPAPAPGSEGDPPDGTAVPVGGPE